MPETLLGFSEVLLFGRVVEDLAIPPPSGDRTVDLTERRRLTLPLTTANNPTVNGVRVANGMRVLVRREGLIVNGIYTVNAANWVRATVPRNQTVFVEGGSRKNRRSLWSQKVVVGAAPGNQRFQRADGKGLGQNSLLGEQLEEAHFARIYGFSYEGTYYELPNPTLFLVHGEGESATDGNQPVGAGNNLHRSRAPTDPSVSGVAAADFQFADDIMVWAYDKADYTIRMDVETGMIEQVLLDAFFGGGDAMISGAKVSGAKVSGAKVSGAKVSGAKVSGAKVSGAKARGPGD